MKRRLPALNAIKGFEAAARLGSFKQAADELCISHSAISHQIKQLELDLGVALFYRGPKRVELTPAGQRYYPVLRQALNNIADATEAITASNRPDMLNIHTHQSFADLWLVPKLQKFREAHPGIEISVSTAPEISFVRGEVDVAITFGRPDPSGGIVYEKLFRSKMFPVCAPAVANGANGPLRTPADLAKHALLQVYLHAAFYDWEHWLKAANVSLDPTMGPHFDTYSLALKAAVAGMGVAMTRDHFSADDIKSGRLIKPFDIEVEASETWFVAHQTDRGHSLKVRAFKDWILSLPKI